MWKPSRIDRIKDKTERVKGLLSLRGRDEDGAVSSSVTREAQEPGNSLGSSARLPLSNTSDTATLSDDNEYQHTPIGELWNLAYKKLQQEDGALIGEYEARLRESVAGALSSTLGAEENKGKWMNTLLRCKMEEVQKNIWKFSFRSSEIQPAEIVQPILGVVKLANDFIATALASNPYASLAWAGVSALLSLFLNPMDQAASLAKGLEYISSLIVQGRIREDLYHRCYETRHGDRQSTSVSHVLYKSTLEKLYRQILKFQATCYCYYAHNGAARLGRDLTGRYDWAGLIETIQKQEGQMAAINQAWSDKQYDEECAAAEERHKETIHSLATIGADISGLRKAVEEANAQQDHRDFYRWLCDVDPSDMYNAARKRHEAGTSEWFMENKEFKSWMNNPRSLLWLHGKAGSGKSVLSSSVIKFLQNKHKGDATVATAYYYFSFSDAKKQERDGMLASLIKQICCCRPNVPESVARLGEYKTKGMRPPTEELEKELIETVRGFSKVHIVIDALDECPELGGRREDLMKTLRYMLNAPPDNLHDFCTSRKEPDIYAEIQPHLSSFARIEFDMSFHEEALTRDICQYIDSTLAAARYKSWPDSTKGEVKETLVEKADGMFQYVRCQFEVLSNLRSSSEIQQALEDLPNGLDQTYERMICAINPKYQRQVLNSLKWLAFSLESLTVDALAEIFVIRPEDDIVISDKIHRLFTAQDVLTYFSGLIIVQDGKVRLSHFSVKEYLTSKRLRQNAPVLGFSETDAHLWIAYSCLAYHIYLSTLDSRQFMDQNWHAENYALKTYAACNWPTHLEMVSREFWTAEVVEKVAFCLTMRSQTLLEMILESRGIERRAGNWFSPKERLDSPDVAVMFVRPYCFTAWRDCTLVTEHLLSQELSIAKYLVQDDLDITLYYAVRGGSLGVARLLLDKGANVNASMTTESDFGSNKSRDALQGAAYQGDFEMVNFLLNKGADVNAQRGGWGSALQAATKRRHMEMLELLVKRGADINGPSNEAGCALSSAVIDFYCFKFLLNNGADINMRGTSDMESTALYEAAKTGHWRIFDLLRRRGAEANLGGTGGYPLHGLAHASAGSYEFSKDISSRMKCLLDLGADPNARSAKCTTALFETCRYYYVGSITVCAQAMEFLIDHGADVNIVGEEDGTALQACALMGHIPMVKLLLEKGADVNIQGGQHGNTLQAACTSFKIGANYDPVDLEMLKLLIDHGADVNCKGGLYWTALQAASCSNRGTGAVDMLLKLGADVNAEGGKYGTALQAACRHGELETVILLLDNGANVNTVVCGEYGTALQAACASHQDQRDEVVRVLLERGACVNAEGGTFGTALQAACANGRCKKQIAIMDMLLKHGAHVVTVQSGKYGSPFQAAATFTPNAGSANDAMRFLLNHGANINDYVLGDFGSALHCVLSQEGFLRNMKTPEWPIGSTGLEHQLEERIRFLLDSGADVNLEGGKYGFPLHAACSVEYDICFTGRYPYFDGLHQRIDHDEKRVEFINTVTDVVKMLLDECPDIDVNARGGIFGTALQAAAYSGQMRSIKQLLDHGADALSNEFCGRYRTALNAAVIKGHWDIVDSLLQAGAKPDCHLFLKPDEKWLAQVRKEDGPPAVERYKKFWEVEKSLHEQTLLRRGRHVAYYHFIEMWWVAQFQLLIGFITAVLDLFLRK